MTAAQYKNIILWTLYFDHISDAEASLTVARKLLDKLGVSFPQGDLPHIVQVLNGRRFLGWTSCTQDEAQRFLDVGVAALAIDDSRVIILLPSQNTETLSNHPELTEVKNDSVKCARDLDAKEFEKMQFFAYSYGYPAPEPKT